MRAWCACCLVACVGTCCGGADRYDVVPELYTQSPQVFRSVFAQATTRTVRALMVGDSQEVSPGGQGNVYVPRWNAEMFAVYGNSPETPVAPMYSSSGGGNPWGDWLSATARSPDGPTESRVEAARMPPNFSACKVSLNNGNNVNNNQWLGQLVGLKHRAEMCNPASLLPGAATYFQRGTAVYVDVIAAGNESSGEVRVDSKPNTTAAQTFFVPVTSTHVSTMGLAGASGAIRHQRLGPFLFGGREYMQIELSGTDATKFTDVVGARIVSAVDSRGWVVQSVAAGGYTSASLLENHPECGAILAAVEPDVAILAYGANDSGSGTGITTTEYHANLVSLIAYLREYLGPRFPIILIADPWRVLDNPAHRDALDRYPGVCYDIAREDAYVCALNSRLLLDRMGWNAGGQATYLADTVHYSAFGAITKARVEVGRLMLAFGAASCTADVDDGTGTGVMDGGVTIDDLLYYLGLFEGGTVGADVDDGTASGTPDGGVTIDDLLYYLVRFEDGC